MSTFSEYESSVLAPGWLQNPRGKGYLQARGGVKDGEIQAVKDAVKARFPGIAPVDALAYIGRERLLDQGPGETEQAYRDRLVGAFDAWKWSGTAYGLLVAFYYAGHTPQSGRVVIQIQNGYQYELRSDFDPAAHAPEVAVVTTALTQPFTLGGTPSALWSDFGVLFLPPTLPSWTTLPADTSAEVNRVRAIIRQWKPAHTRCVLLGATSLELWDAPQEPWEPTSDVWDEAGVSATWTPPQG